MLSATASATRMPSTAESILVMVTITSATILESSRHEGQTDLAGSDRAPAAIVQEAPRTAGYGVGGGHPVLIVDIIAAFIDPRVRY